MQLLSKVTIIEPRILTLLERGWSIFNDRLLNDRIIIEDIDGIVMA
ncbi:MAG: hypothetical protein QNJ54_10160 [Prochloraceae cyanobacterium]|nr:hypothetical protein [Prochloraceae cyanobacterium]